MPKTMTSPTSSLIEQLLAPGNGAPRGHDTLARLLGAQKVPSRRKKFRDGTSGSKTALLNIKQGTDVPGTRTQNFADWRQVISESDYLIYMFDAHKLLNRDDDHRRAVTSDCTIVGQLIYEHHGRQGQAQACPSRVTL